MIQLDNGISSADRLSRGLAAVATALLAMGAPYSSAAEPIPPAPAGNSTVVASRPVARLDDDGCHRGTQRVSLEGVQFASNQATLTKRAMASIKMSESTLETHPSLRVEVRGHADSEERNAAKLSAERATVVKNYLVHEGVDPARLTTKAMGSRFPVASNDFPDGREANRRVELIPHE